MPLSFTAACHLDLSTDIDVEHREDEIERVFPNVSPKKVEDVNLLLPWQSALKIGNASFEVY